MCDRCAGVSPERAELCSRIREATAAVSPDEFTIRELRELAHLMESVVASRHRDGLPARLAELINLGR
jgi:hypothetical protein